MKVLVTGPSGFVASHLLTTRVVDSQSQPIEWIPLSTRGQYELPRDACPSIVHCAGLAHQMHGCQPEKYFEVNFTKTVELAQRCKSKGVAHFLYLSSSKVFGDLSPAEGFAEDSPCQPTDPYGESKRKAELALLDLASPGFIVSIIRPPMIFGAGVKGNMLKFLGLLDSAWPLPFGSATAHRSMVNIDNLNALICQLLLAPVEGIFHAGESFSPEIRQLATEVRKAFHRQPRFFPVPQPFIKILALVKPQIVRRLFDGMVLQTRWTNQRLSFSPPIPFQDGIEKMVEWYRQLQVTEHRAR